MTAKLTPEEKEARKQERAEQRRREKVAEKVNAANEGPQEAEPGSLPPPPDEPAPEPSLSTSRGGRPKKDVKLQRLREDLLDAGADGVAIFSPLPTAQAVFADGWEKQVNNMVILCRRYPWLMKRVEQGTTAFALLGLSAFTGRVMYAAACDMGVANPASPIAERAGITDVYLQTHPGAVIIDEEDEEEASVEPSDNGAGGLLRAPGVLGDLPPPPPH